MSDRFEVRATPAAARGLDALRGDAKRAWEKLLPGLRSRGCEEAGYRLLGAERAGYSEYCVKHLVGDWRVLTSFPDLGVVQVVAVGQHDGDGFYASLVDLGISGTGQHRDAKPACCGDEGWPTMGEPRRKR